MSRYKLGDISIGLIDLKVLVGVGITIYVWMEDIGNKELVMAL